MSTAAEPVHARAEAGRVEPSRAEDRMGTAQKVTLFEISYTAHVDFFRETKSSTFATEL